MPRQLSQYKLSYTNITPSLLPYTILPSLSIHPKLQTLSSTEKKRRFPQLSNSPMKDDELTLSLSLFPFQPAKQEPRVRPFPDSPKEEDELTLSLSSFPKQNHSLGVYRNAIRSFKTRSCRRKPRILFKEGKEETIDPPFPWATDRRAIVHRIDYLLARGLSVISGEVQCKRCDYRKSMEFNLEEKFAQVEKFVAENKYEMANRASPRWMNPKLPSCNECGIENCMEPVKAKKKRDINWLFLLLGEMLGVCSVDRLKYLCKHNNINRTGCKDWLLYYAYLGICKQLKPIDLFETM
ncbi:uncharacterized protein LOC144702625 [Wolffia australiana]